jgi:hypothetical protein
MEPLTHALQEAAEALEAHQMVARELDRLASNPGTERCRKDV